MGHINPSVVPAPFAICYMYLWLLVCITESQLLTCLVNFEKLVLFHIGVIHVTIAVSCALFIIIVFQMAIKNWTKLKI